MREKPLEAAFAGSHPSSRFLLDLAAGRSVNNDQLVTPGLIESAQRHGLISLLAEVTDDRFVHAIQVREGSRRRVLERHLHRILTRFEDVQIPVAVLKGPAVAGWYRNPRHRTFSDLDLLVPADELDRAMNLLGDDPATARIPEKRPKADKRDVLLEDETGILFNVDLHWDLFSYSQMRGTSRSATELAWKEAYPDHDSALGPRWMLPFGVKAAFLAAHAILDHRFRLILFRDLLEISLGSPDWDSLLEVAGVHGLGHVSYVSFWIAKNAVGARIPEGVLDELRPNSLLVRYLEDALPEVDLATFDGGTVHPVNLASVLLNDSLRIRTQLAIRAPFAVRGWRRRVAEGDSVNTGPRVLIVVASDRRRGAEVFAERLAAGLLRRGMFAETIGLTTSDASTARTQIGTLTDVRLSDAGKFSLRIARSLRRKIRASNPGIVIVSGPTLRYGVVATAGLNVKLGYLAIGEPAFWIRSRWRGLVHRALLRRVDRVLAVSKMTSRQLIDLEPKLDGKVDVVFTGVEPFSSQGKGGDGEHESLRVLIVGALSYEKGPLTALSVVAAVDNARARFVGEGHLYEPLNDRVQESGLGDRVEIIGSVEDVGPELDWADVLLLTSRTEGLPGVVLEAAIAGVPSIAFDVGGVREAIEDGVTGVLAAPGNPEDLVSELKALDADRSRLRAFGEAARAHVETRFGMEKVIDDYAQVIRAILVQP